MGLLWLSLSDDILTRQSNVVQMISLMEKQESRLIFPDVKIMKKNTGCGIFCISLCSLC